MKRERGGWLVGIEELRRGRERPNFYFTDPPIDLTIPVENPDAPWIENPEAFSENALNDN